MKMMKMMKSEKETSDDEFFTECYWKGEGDNGRDRVEYDRKTRITNQTTSLPLSLSSEYVVLEGLLKAY
jgi:hypothetical protein